MKSNEQDKEISNVMNRSTATVVAELTDVELVAVVIYLLFISLLCCFWRDSFHKRAIKNPSYLEG